MLQGDTSVPVGQHWMAFFNETVAKKLTPPNCHYKPMWLYDVADNFDMTAIGKTELDKMVEFNNYTGRCFSCLGRGGNIAWGHGGPGEFFMRTIERGDNHLIIETETGAKEKIQFKPHFRHLYDQPVKTIDDVEKLELPDPNDPERYKGLAEDIAYLKSKGEYVVASLNGFFSGIHYFLMDYQQTLMGIILEPDLINALLDKLGNWNIAAAKNLLKAGADCIAFCDDLGSKESLLFSPTQYRQFFKPWHKKLCETAHDGGVTVHLHSHGAITALLDDLVECGFDFINPFDPEEGFELENLLQKYGDKFVVVGGLPTKFWEWSPENQQQHFEKITSLGKKYGRYIVMDSGGIPENVVKEDFDRILNLSKKLRGVEKFEGAI